MRVFVIFGKRLNPWMILSPIICWVNKTPFSHTAILVSDESGDWVYESTMPESHKIPFKKWLDHYDLKASYEITKRIVDIDKTKENLNQWLGIKYSYLQLLMAGLSLLFVKIFKPKKINGSRRLICAEYVGMFLSEHCGIVFTKPLDYVTLSDISDAVSK